MAAMTAPVPPTSPGCATRIPVLVRGCFFVIFNSIYLTLSRDIYPLIYQELQLFLYMKDTRGVVAYWIEVQNFK